MKRSSIRVSDAHLSRNRRGTVTDISTMQGGILGLTDGLPHHQDKRDRGFSYLAARLPALDSEWPPTLFVHMAQVQANRIACLPR